MARIGIYSFEEYLHLVQSFHGSVAPGLVIGGFMVDLAMKRLPEGVLFDAISETTSCLPDAVQLLTPCTVGNGWLKVFNLGRFALSLYEKYEGKGVRVFVDPEKLESWPEIKTWLFKLKPKREQDKEFLMSQIEQAGHSICSSQPVAVQAQFLEKKSRGRIATCVLCHEPYPARDGAICRGCQGDAPYAASGASDEGRDELPPLRAVSSEEAVGKRVLHDMTLIVPGAGKGAAFTQGQRITVGDLCRLQQMGRQKIYVEEENEISAEWVHENEAALAFAKGMAGEGITFDPVPHEGKINLIAERDGLFVVREDRLEQFNMIQGVMCASRKTCALVEHGRPIAATRAIPLFLPRADFERALAVLHEGPLFTVLSLRKAKVGILVTGSEVFQGLVEDKFVPIISAKVEKHGCNVVRSLIAPDDRAAIGEGLRQLMEAGADLLITTAGLSVDPDDVTRQGLIDAGATDLFYGTPIIPGAMLLLARIGSVQVMGVPACALYFKTTGFDLLLPRMLAGIEPTRRDIARLGHGAFCLGCKTCTFPKCPFGG
jgi:formylmethanofuran dehydrogenase subunit E